MVTLRFLHRDVSNNSHLRFDSGASCGDRDIFELSQDAWTWDRTANEREMKLSLDRSRRSLKMVRQETYPGRHV
jgi:hypothetical protein